MRAFLDLVESFTSPCTKYWFNTQTGEAVTGKNANEHHFDILMRSPQTFGLSADALQAKMTSYDNSSDPAEREADEESRREFAELDLVHAVTMTEWARVGRASDDEEAYIFSGALRNAVLTGRWMSKNDMIGEALHVEIINPNETAAGTGDYREISGAPRIKQFLATGK